jgi:hypothetical protein
MFVLRILGDPSCYRVTVVLGGVNSISIFEATYCSSSISSVGHNISHEFWLVRMARLGGWRKGTTNHYSHTLIFQ